MKTLRTGKAPGHPGADSSWESSRKTGVGQACNFVSRVWVTIGEGILNEIYFPHIDQPCTKDCGLIVTDGSSFFSEEKIDTHSEIHWAAEGVPAFRVTNTHRGGRYRIHKEIVADPDSHVIFQRTRFEALKGELKDYRVYVLLAPHLGDEGVHNTASFGSSKGMALLLAESKVAGLALGCSTGWKGRSVGFVGKSDGWQDLMQHKELRWHYDSAPDGNVALTGEIHLPDDGCFVLGIGFGQKTSEAIYRLRASLSKGFDSAWNTYCDEWIAWQKQLKPLEGSAPATRIYRSSTAVLRTHEATDFPGGRTASLSVPWGEVQKQDHAAGYHAVWPRDCAQSAIGLLACGAPEDALRTLTYLANVQEADGHWPQAMWVDGSSYLTAIQIDSIAAPILLFEIARQEGVLAGKTAAARYWPMVKKAAEFICRNGPTSEEDRWERNSGFSVYTLALAIAGLVIAGNAAREQEEEDLARYLFETADAWQAQIENWSYCRESNLLRALRLPGYYCRVVPTDKQGRPDFDQEYPLANSLSKSRVVPREVVSPDVWALVRYGLRAPNDRRIHQTTEAIDATLKTDTPCGPVWHRFNHDGYGETPDGEPFSKKGIGRGWPLLTGERAHQELAEGNVEEAKRLFETMENFAGEVGLLSEQVWDSDDIPGKKLFLGKASGSARPLAWTHAEHIQLLRSLRDGRIFDCPRIVAKRYVENGTRATHTPWRPGLQSAAMAEGTILRVETNGPARLSWSSGEGGGEAMSVPSPVGLHYIDLPTQDIRSGEVSFVFYDDVRGKWQDEVYKVKVVKRDAERTAA